MTIQSKFPRTAATHLKEVGFIAELLVEHDQALLEFQLTCDLDVTAPARRKAKRGEDPLIPVAEMFIKVACAWPPETQLFGVNMVGRFDDVFIQMADRDSFLAIPVSHRTEAVLIHGLKTRALRISSIEPADMTDTIMRACVSSNPEVIMHHANSEGWSIAPYDILLKACQAKPGLLDQISPDCYTDELVDIALKGSGLAFKGLPERYITPERCLNMVKNHGYLDMVPTTLLTEEMVVIALAKSRHNVKAAPVHMLTEENVLKALRTNADLLLTLPDQFATLEFYAKAIAQNPKVLYELRRVHLPDSMIIEAIDRNVTAVQFLSETQLKPAVVDFLIAKRPEALMMLPRTMITPQLALKAMVGGWPFAVMLLKPEDLTPDVLIEAVREDYKVLTVLPKELITEDLEIEALRQNGALLRLVDEDSRTHPRCLAALTKGTDALDFIPDHLLESSSFRHDARLLNPELAVLWGPGTRKYPELSAGL